MRIKEEIIKLCEQEIAFNKGLRDKILTNHAAIVIADHNVIAISNILKEIKQLNEAPVERSEIES
jgi:hypothetical protein